MRWSLTLLSSSALAAAAAFAQVAVPVPGERPNARAGSLTSPMSVARDTRATRDALAARDGKGGQSVQGGQEPPRTQALQSTQSTQATQARQGRYWADAWRGWHFYEEPQPGIDAVDSPDIRDAPPAAETAPPLLVDRAPELFEFDRLQKTLEDFRHIAIMRPTEANVRRYMALEARVVARASYFADVAQRVAWSTPELDPSLHGRPTNAKALEVFEQRQRDDRSSVVAALGRDHVLLFFFRSDCPYCHAFTPTMRAFEARHGLQVVPIGVDGGSLPGYPNARKDNGIASALKVSQVPAVFLAQPFTGTITPIGFGVLSESQLLERIATVSTPESHAMLPSATQHVVLP